MGRGQLQQGDNTIIPIGARVALQRLDEELALLREAMGRIDPNSKDPDERWAISIYQKIIKRRERLMECLDAN